MARHKAELAEFAQNCDQTNSLISSETSKA